MDENLIEQTTEEYDMETMSVHDVTVDPEETVVVDIGESMGWVNGDPTYHDSLLGIEFPNQHPIEAISLLREELDEIERLKSVYSDKLNTANYYKWGNGKTYNTDGYFVSMIPRTSEIKVYSGDDGEEILGVLVNGAGFIGGQDATIPRDNTYGLVATSGVVRVRYELGVDVGDHVVSNANGYAKKSDSDYGYQVLSLMQDKITGEKYALISLGIQADKISLLGANVAELNDRMDAAESNIVSAINAANEAYQKATEIGEANAEMSGKVDGALSAVDQMTSDVSNLGEQISNSLLVAEQAKVIANIAVTSAEKMRDEAVEKAKEALVKNTELRNELAADVARLDAELDVKTAELKSVRDELSDSIDEAVKDMESAKDDLQDVSTQLSNSLNGIREDVDAVFKDLEPLATWKSGDQEGIAGFVAKADANGAVIGQLAEWKGQTGDKTLAGFVSDAMEGNAHIQALADYTYTDKNNVTHNSVAAIKAHVDANEASIKEIVGFDGNIAGLEARVTEVESAASLITSRINAKYVVIPVLPSDVEEENRDTSKVYSEYSDQDKKVYYHYYRNGEWKKTELIAQIPNVNTNNVYYIEANKTYRYYQNQFWQITSDIYKTTLPTSSAGLQAVVDDTKAQIDIVASKETQNSSAIAGIQEFVSANKASLDMLVSYQRKDAPEGENNKGVAGIIAQVDENKSNIDGFAKFGDSLAGMQAQADANSAAVATLASHTIGDYITIKTWESEDKADNSQIYYNPTSKQYHYHSEDQWMETSTFDNTGADINRIYYIESLKRYYFVKQGKTSWVWSEKPYTAGLTGAIAGIQQIADENKAQLSAVVNYEKGDKKGLAGLMAQVTANQSAIDTLTKWGDGESEGLAGLTARVDANESNVALVSQYIQGNYTVVSDLVDENKRDGAEFYYDSKNQTYWYWNTGWVEDDIFTNLPILDTMIYYVPGTKLYWHYVKNKDDDGGSWQSTNSAYDAGLPSAIGGIQVVTDKNSSTINSLTSWQGDTNISMARIEQKADANGAYIQSTVSNMDRYSVGPHSQAYGFALEQAAKVLEEGMIYVPTEDKTEENGKAEVYKRAAKAIKDVTNEADRDVASVYYTTTTIDDVTETTYYYYGYNDQYTSDGDAPKYKWISVDDFDSIPEYTREFIPGFLYRWGRIGGDGFYGWTTIDKNYNITDEINMSAMAVYFSITEIAVADGFGYWYTNGDTITSLPTSTATYEPYTLYKWDTYTTVNDDGESATAGRWTPVATLAGNSQSRAVSQIRQDANRIEMSITSIEGSYTGLRAELTDTQADLQTLTSWKSEDGESLVTFAQNASDKFASATQVASIVDKDGNVKEASIVAAVNNNASSIYLSADNIRFDGSVTFANKSDVDAVQNSAVYSASVEYALSSSATSFAAVEGTDGQWSTTAPPWRSDAYMWQRTTITKGDGLSSTVQTCIQGAHGQDGTGVAIKGTAYTESNVDDSMIGKSYNLYSDDSCANKITGAKDGESYLVSGYLFVYSGSGDEFTCAGKIQGPAGDTPTVEIDDDGYWVIGGVNTGKQSKGETGITPILLKSWKEFAVSTSNATAPTSGWSKTLTGYDKSQNKIYIWTRTGEEWDLDGDGAKDGDTFYTDASFESAVTSISAWCKEKNETYIDGANIATGTITAEQLSVDAIMSDDYPVADNGDPVPPDDTFSSNGMFVDVKNGAIYSKGFTLKKNGDAFFGGTLTADAVDAISISANQITSGTIDASKITVTNLDATNITSGTIDANNIDVINLKAGSITSGELNAEIVKAIEIDASQITTGQLRANQIEAVNIDASQINVVAGSGNLARPEYIEHSGVTVTQLTDYSWNITKESAYAGTAISSSIFEVGQRYVISYYVKKTGDTLQNIGGHAEAFTIHKFTIDGVDSTTPYTNPGTNAPDDTETHYVVVYVTYNGGTGQNNFYIQPNRDLNTKVSYKLWNIKVERGEIVTGWTDPNNTIGVGNFGGWHITPETIYTNNYGTFSGMKAAARYEMERSSGLMFTSNGDGTCYVSGIGSCEDAIIAIPSISPNGDVVTGIGANVFDRNNFITYVIIPSSVTTILGNAFFHCTNLLGIYIPRSVTRIIGYTFSLSNKCVLYCEFTSVTISTTGVQNGWDYGVADVVYGANIDEFKALINDGICTSLVNDGETSAPRFFAGSATDRPNPSNSKFLVLEDGSLYASAAKISGNISAGRGNIGYWDIEQGSLFYGDKERQYVELSALNGLSIQAYDTTTQLLFGITDPEVTKTYTQNSITLSLPTGMCAAKTCSIFVDNNIAFVTVEWPAGANSITLSTTDSSNLLSGGYDVSKLHTMFDKATFYNVTSGYRPIVSIKPSGVVQFRKIRADQYYDSNGTLLFEAIRNNFASESVYFKVTISHDENYNSIATITPYSDQNCTVHSKVKFGLVEATFKYEHALFPRTSTVTFDLNGSTSAQAILDHIANKCTIRFSTDDSGSTSYNLTLMPSDTQTIFTGFCGEHYYEDAGTTKLKFHVPCEFTQN